MSGSIAHLSSALDPIEAWFDRRGWEPFPFQREVWEAYLSGESGLIHAPTGTGKTYAAWMGPLAEWIASNRDVSSGSRSTARGDRRAGEEPPLHVLWITPLRALAADTAEALRAPIADLDLPWTLELRTGDTSSSAKSRQNRRLPTALVTTPESLAILLSQGNASTLFRSLRAVVVDEWHELLGSKRGTLLELGLARLRRWNPDLKTWGLSATVGNLATAAQTLVGNSKGKRQNSKSGPSRAPRLVMGMLAKDLRIDSLIPESTTRFPWAGHLGLTMLPEVVRAIEEGKSALVFTNTRSQTERWYQALLDERPEWAGEIALHHGSLERDTRRWVEENLAEGNLRCVVSTSTLELGVDFAPVDRVLQIGSPKGVARLVQRAGRSGHQPGSISRVTCVPTHAFELVEAAAARREMERGRIEAREPYRAPLDVLAQHLVTCALGGGFDAEELFGEVRTAWSYRDLTEEEFSWVLDFITTGGPALKAYPEYRRVVVREGRFVVEDQTIARRHRVSIGTIMSDASMRVKYMRGGDIGTLDESFISRLKHGDRFIFAGRVLEFVRIKDMTALVRRATGTSGVVPRWTGGRLPISEKLGEGVRLMLDEAARGEWTSPEMESVRPLLDLQALWSKVPARDELLIERIRTRRGHHLAIYPFEGRGVHEGMAALVAWRLSRRRTITFTVAHNDYGFELLSADPAPLDEALANGLFSTEGLVDDIHAALNETEMARRGFREIARIAGLVFPGYPGSGKTTRQMQASSGLIFDVLERYDPENLLLRQARSETLDRGLEIERLCRAMERIGGSRFVVVDAPRPTPLAFPLMVERLREQIGSESLMERIERMVAELERAAEKTVSAAERTSHATTRRGKGGAE